MGFKHVQYTSMGQAKRETGLSYLGGTNISYKTSKNEKLNVLTYILYLAPHTMSGYNVCPMATTHCSKACLHSSGRNRINYDNTINKARVKKTKLFYENRDYFMAWLVDELMSAEQKALKNGMQFSVRINGTSDLSLETFKHKGYNLLQLFPNVQFYDYTKVPRRITLANKYDNYDLTFSYSGENWEDCVNALKNNVRVAVVFETVPDKFKGYDVINGDETDIRYYDKGNVIVGLKFKKVRKKINLKNNPFIITNDMIK